MTMRAVYASLFVATMLVTLIARFPLAAVVHNVPLAMQYSAVTGTIWHGTVHDVVVQGEDVGDVSLSLSPLPLLRGAASGSVSLDGDSMTASGRFFVSANVITIRSAKADIDLQALRVRDTLGQPMRGRFKTDITEIRVVHGQCETADFTVETDALAASLGAFASRGFTLTGQASCRDGDLFVPLAGEGPDAAVLASLQLSGDGTYATSLEVTPSRQDLGLFLANFGFVQEGDRFITTTSGKLEQYL